MYVYVILSLFCVSASFIVADGRLAQVYSDGDSNNDCELEHGDCNHDRNEVSLALKSSECTEWCLCEEGPSLTGGSAIYQWSIKACPSGSLFDDGLGNCNYYSHLVLCEEKTTATKIPSTEPPETDGNGDDDDECQRQHGACNIYTNENRLALKGSGCMEWCQCMEEPSPSGGSATYKWTKQECPPGRLFDERWNYCITASRVECDEPEEETTTKSTRAPTSTQGTTTVADTHSTELPHTDGDGEADAGCQREHAVCSQCTGVNTYYKALKSSGCVIFCQCTPASTQSDDSVACRWTNHTCPGGLLFDEVAKVCNFAHHVQCKEETTTETTNTPATTTEINECLSNPCANGGTCKNLQNGYTCTCTAGWQGTSCDEDVNECASNPCQNGAQCTNGQNSYTCICAAGWSGTTCQTDINECSSNPCANDATCNNLQNGYTCTCPEGWQGTNCDEDINECLSNPCANGGMCNNLQNRYTCTCKGGWQGTNCDEDINECSSNPCANGATCSNLQNRYTCTCPGGWTGTNCEEDINECSNNPCANGATCDNLQNRYTCTCTEGWQGINCDEDINECMSNPCANGATCTNLQNRYTCTCTAGWQGTNCEVVKSVEKCYKCHKERSNSACNQKTEVCKDKEKSCETSVEWNGHKYEVSKGCKKPTPSKEKSKGKSKGKSKLGCQKKGKKIDCRYECKQNLCNEPLPAKDINK